MKTNLEQKQKPLHPWALLYMWPSSWWVCASIQSSAPIYLRLATSAAGVYMLSRRDLHMLVLPQCRDTATGTSGRISREVRREQHSHEYLGIPTRHVTVHASRLHQVSGFKHKTANRVSCRAARDLLHTHWHKLHEQNSMSVPTGVNVVQKQQKN